MEVVGCVTCAGALVSRVDWLRATSGSYIKVRELPSYITTVGSVGSGAMEVAPLAEHQLNVATNIQLYFFVRA